MARSQPSVFVNCDKCQYEEEIILEDDIGRTMESQVDEELLARGWLVSDEEDTCNECSIELAQNALARLATKED